MSGIGIGIGIGLRKVLRGFTSEYQSVYDAFTIKPSASIAKQQNILVKSLVDSGVWAKLDTFYVLAGHTNNNGESLINWFNPGTFNATLVNSPAFVALEGFTGNGTTSYINFNYNPSSDAINYSLNSASIGIYVRTDNIGSYCAIGLRNGTFVQIFPRITNEMTLAFHDAAGLSVANLDGKGFYIGTRTASNSITLYKNKIGTSDSIVSSVIPNGNLFGLARNNVGSGAETFSVDQESMKVTGSALTQTDVNNLTDAFEAYMDSNGKGVIP